jgi:hypothetical protein
MYSTKRIKITDIRFQNTTEENFESKLGENDQNQKQHDDPLE